MTTMPWLASGLALTVPSVFMLGLASSPHCALMCGPWLLLGRLGGFPARAFDAFHFKGARHLRFTERGRRLDGRLPEFRGGAGSQQQGRQ